MKEFCVCLIGMNAACVIINIINKRYEVMFFNIAAISLLFLDILTDKRWNKWSMNTKK